MSKQPPKSLVHKTARPQVPLEELMDVGPLPQSPPPPVASTEPTIATEDPEPGTRPPRKPARATAAPAEPPEPDEDPWVPYTTQIRRSTYIGLKQAEYYTPGFEQRKFVDAALKSHFSTNKYSGKRMPPEEELKMLNSKILKGK